MIRNKSPESIKKDIMDFRYYYIHPYDFRLQDILYKVLKSWEKQDISSEIEIIFSDKDIYEDYKNMLRKKYMLVKNYTKLKNNEWLILVSSAKQLFYNEWTGWEAQQTFYYTSNSIGHNKIYLTHATDCETLTVMIEHANWYKIHSLPTAFTKRLMTYFDRYQKNVVHDCHDFERHMLGMDRFSYSEFIWPESRDWNYDTLQIWDAIWLYDSDSIIPKHKAIYFWNHFFISKYGLSVLTVATLEQMHLTYGTNAVTLNRFFWDTDTYKKMKEQTKEILKTHPDRDRLNQIFSCFENGGD